MGQTAAALAKFACSLHVAAFAGIAVINHVMRWAEVVAFSNYALIMRWTGVA